MTRQRAPARGSQAARPAAACRGLAPSSFSFFLIFIDLIFFGDFKKVVVCWCVGQRVLFYLVSQSNESTIEECEACETKNWRES